MAKRKGKVYPLEPDKGLTSAELTEVKTLEANVVQEEAREAASAPSYPYKPLIDAGSSLHKPEPAAYKPPPVPAPPSPAKAAEEIKCLEADIVKAQARIHELQHPYVPFPKMVKGHTFNDQAALDAAGPEYAG